MRTLIVFAAQYLYLIIILIAVISAIFTNYENKKITIKLTIIALPVAFIVGKILNYFIISPRPFVVEKIQPLLPHGADNGFPSDHTLLTMTVSTIVLTYNRKLGISLGILSLLVGITRVMAKVHHPIDVIGGSLIAYGATSAVFLFLKATNK